MSKDLKILILIGVPASGKSTWTNDFLRNNPDYVRVSRDGFRHMLRNDGAPEPKIEGLITDLVNDVIYKCLSRKLSIIIDSTNLKRSHIMDIVNEFKYSADIDFRVFDISLKKAIERDSLRNDREKVGDKRITEMFEDYKVLMDSFDFQPINKIKHRPHVIPDFNSKLPECVIFDIDGTLALMGNRSAFDWMKTFKDDKNDIVAEQMDFHRSKGRKIIIVSGRDGICKKLTEDWLDLYEMTYERNFRKD